MTVPPDAPPGGCKICAFVKNNYLLVGAVVALGVFYWLKKKQIKEE